MLIDVIECCVLYLLRSLLLPGLGLEHPFGDVLMPDDHAVGMVLRRQSGETAVRDPLPLDVEDVGFVELDTLLPVRTPNKKVSLWVSWSGVFTRTRRW